MSVCCCYNCCKASGILAFSKNIKSLWWEWFIKKNCLYQALPSEARNCHPHCQPRKCLHLILQWYKFEDQLGLISMVSKNFPRFVLNMCSMQDLILTASLSCLCCQVYFCKPLKCWKRVNKSNKYVNNEFQNLSSSVSIALAPLRKLIRNGTKLRNLFLIFNPPPN